MNTNVLNMLTPDDLDRRTCLKGISLGAGAVVLQPFVNALAAEAAGEAPPLRVVFLMQGNGLWPHHVQPKGVDHHQADRLIDLPLAELELPEPIAALVVTERETVRSHHPTVAIGANATEGRGSPVVPGGYRDAAVFTTSPCEAR